MPEYEIKINPAVYQQQLITEIDAHIASLNKILESLDNGTYWTDRPIAGFVVRHQLQNSLDSDVIRKTEIDETFKAIVTAFLDYLDRMIALSEIISNGVEITRALKGKEEIREYARQYLEDAILKVSANRSLTNPAKLGKFPGLTSFSKNAAEGYISIRNCLEHRKNIADRDIQLTYKAIKIFHNDNEITELPHAVEPKGFIGSQFAEESRIIQSGEVITITEPEIYNVSLTIKIVIATEVLILLNLNSQRL